MTEQNKDKTFTQADVDSIVQQRLAEDRQRHGADLEKREQDLQAREFKYKLREQAQIAGIPFDVLDAFNIVDEESMNKAFAALKPITDKNVDTPATIVSTGGSHSENGKPGDSALRSAFGLNSK